VVNADQSRLTQFSGIQLPLDELAGRQHSLRIDSIHGVRPTTGTKSLTREAL
jgi:hypothetical protein